MNNFDYYGANPYFADKQREKKEIKVIGRTAGLCIIAFVILEQIVTLPFFIPSIRELYTNNGVFGSSVDIILSTVCVLVPFAIGGAYLGKRTGADIAPLEKPYSVPAAVLLVFAGMAVCIAGDYAATFTINIFDTFGFKLSLPDTEAPDSIWGRVVYVISVAFVAPLCEEYAIRGCIMQPLRKYGDIFAIVSSSVVFAVLHGNIIQLPFAFIAGLGMGYAVCATGSVWTSVFIHFLNNLFSCVTFFAQADLAPEDYVNFYYAVQVSLAVMGVLCAIGYCFISTKRRLNKPVTLTQTGEKAAAFYLNVPMIIAIITMLLMSTLYISRA